MDFSKLSKEAKAKIAEVFESNPAMESCTATVDGMCFQNKHYALAHEKEMMFAAGSEKERAACIGIIDCKREDVLATTGSKEPKTPKAPKAPKATQGSNEPVMVDHTVDDSDLNNQEFKLQFPDAKLGDVVKIAEPETK